MSETWIEMGISVPAAAVDLLGHEMLALGSVGVITAEEALDTFVPPDPDEPMLGEQLVRVFFPETADLEGLRRKVRERLEFLSSLVPGLTPHLPEARRFNGEDWAQGWRQHFTTMHIGRRLIVAPTWEEPPPAVDQVVVRLDPGMAFGTGTHATTRLCLEALAECFEGSTGPEAVLDVGTGSGILAIAASALGAREVLACDIEEEAVRVARDNARLNGVAEGLRITAEPLESLSGTYQVVLANILAEELVRLAPELVRRLAPSGVLVLSGILQEKEPLVQEGFAPFGLEGPEVRRHEEWSCLVYRRGA